MKTDKARKIKGAIVEYSESLGLDCIIDRRDVGKQVLWSEGRGHVAYSI